MLIIEDSEDDAHLITGELQRGGFAPTFTRVESAGDLDRALALEEFDVIIADYSLPQFTGMAALRIVQDTGRDIPFLLVSGSVAESTIVDAMRAGARDYVMKENLTRLPLAVRRELAEASERRRRREFDEQMRHTQRLESLGILAGGVAHDFNNLLTGVLGNASLALELIQVTSEARPLLEQVVQAAEQAASLTRQLLAYAGKGRFLIEPLDLSAVVRDARPLLHASVQRNIRLLFELHGALPLVEGDRGQVQQLLMNLVINAAEAIGQDGHGTVLVRTGTHRLQEDEIRTSVIPDTISGEYVCLEVRDTGSGMDSDTQGRIFDPFFTTKFTGRGLGLSAVMGIARSHKGTITLASEPGRGTTFTVYLPRPEQAPARLRHAGDLRGMVLLVDDDETVRSAAKAVLEQHGLNVLEAASGEAGIEYFLQYANQISLVLLDVTMPDLSGHEVLQRIRGIRAGVPVLVSSGYSEPQAMEHFRGMGVSGFVQKPYTADKLVRRVGSVLAEPHAA